MMYDQHNRFQSNGLDIDQSQWHIEKCMQPIELSILVLKGNNIPIQSWISVCMRCAVKPQSACKYAYESLDMMLPLLPSKTYTTFIVAWFACVTVMPPLLGHTNSSRTPTDRHFANTIQQVQFRRVEVKIETEKTFTGDRKEIERNKLFKIVGTVCVYIGWRERNAFHPT